jgi:hypothetical protein
MPRTPRLSDPYTGQPYGFTRRSKDNFMVCATFEAPQRLPAATDFDPETGCITALLRL